ncbi:MAG: hypothetical protein K2X66_17900 [Cyanobacteria bacterium]|nr:hypothetical protein [Cyanobacteriota bacterium]
MLNPSLPPMARTLQNNYANAVGVKRAPSQLRLATATPQADVQFAGIFSGLKKMFSAFGAWWNKKGDDALASNAIAVFEQKRQDLAKTKDKALDLRATIEGNYRRQAAKLEDMKKELAQKEAAAIQAHEKSTTVTDTKVQAVLLTRAKEAATEAKTLAEIVATQEKTVLKAQLDYQLADKKANEYVAQLHKADAVLKTAQTKVKQAELNEESAKMSEMLNEFNGMEGLKSDETARLLEKVDERLYKSEAKANGNGKSAEELAAEIQADNILKDTGAEDALAALLAKKKAEKGEATKTQSTGGNTTSSNTGGNPVLDNHDGGK